MSCYRRKFRAYRRRRGSVIFGVCGGLADHFDLPAWSIRALFILFVVATGGLAFPVALYLLLALWMKPEPREPFHNFNEEEVYNSYVTSRPETVEKLERSFSRLDKRLQRLESIVTNPSFECDEELRRL
ncbi:MAG: PspC domain-containing protein [Candidatus Latescibacterota bacterium]|nr:MAG: PspC domain-containing protein [Candidatus Latescibacterota bacterium]